MGKFKVSIITTKTEEYEIEATDRYDAYIKVAKNCEGDLLGTTKDIKYSDPVALPPPPITGIVPIDRDRPYMY